MTSQQNHRRFQGLLVVCALIAPGLALADACVGEVITPPAGMEQAEDAALLAAAIGAPLGSKLCKGRVFVAKKPITVFRVWDASKSYTLYGNWWSFNPPKGPRDNYQVANAICPEWSPMNIVSSCTIKVGTKLVVGPSQSSKCISSVLPATAANQVYIPNDSRNNIVFVENCSSGVAWP